MSGTYPSPQFQSVGVGIAAPASGVAGDFSGGSVTATSSTTSRISAARAADVINVLDYGAVQNTGTDSTLAFNAACSTAAYYGRDVYIPPGTYRLNSQVNVQANQIVRGASDHSTTIYIDQAFSSTANGVFSLNGFESGAPEIRDLYIQFQQPPNTVTTLTAAANSGATTIAVASVAGISINNYVSDTSTGYGTALPMPMQVQSIAGNVITLTAPLVANLGSGVNVYFGPSRSNMLTLAAGGTSGAGGTGVMYPPAIYAPNSQTNRFRVTNVHIEGAWDGIYSPGANPWLRRIEMGAAHYGWNTDGQNALDFAHVEGWHSWVWGGGAGIGWSWTMHEYGNVIAMNLGRIDGLNMTNICLMDSMLVETANNPSAWTITGLMLDGSGACFVKNGTGVIKITGMYTSGGTPSPVQVNNGFLSISNCLIQWGGTVPGVVVTGGTLQMSGSLINLANGANVAISQTGGTLVFNNNYISAPASTTVAAINQTGGVTMIMNNNWHVGVSGPAINVGVDNLGTTVVNNSVNNYTINIPSGNLAGTYQRGTFGGGTPWGNQLVLGSLNQGGRVDFRRGNDASATAWIGMLTASTTTHLALTNVSGSSNVILNPTLANVFQINSVEVGRFDVNGIGAAKVTAAAVAPGAGFAKLAFIAGTNAGTGKLVAYCGTSTTPVTIMDNIGTGF